MVLNNPNVHTFFLYTFISVKNTISTEIVTLNENITSKGNENQKCNKSNCISFVEEYRFPLLLTFIGSSIGVIIIILHICKLNQYKGILIIYFYTIEWLLPFYREFIATLKSYQEHLVKEIEIRKQKEHPAIISNKEAELQEKSEQISTIDNLVNDITNANNTLIKYIELKDWAMAGFFADVIERKSIGNF